MCMGLWGTGQSIELIFSGSGDGRGRDVVTVLYTTVLKNVVVVLEKQSAMVVLGA